MMKIWLTGICVLLLCGLYVPAVAQEPAPIKVGLLVTLSGPFKYFGTAIRQEVEYTVERINKQGGVLGRPLKLVVADTELNAEVAVQRATELILDEGVKFIALGGGSHVGEALLPLAEKHSILLFSGAQFADKLTGEQCSRYFFRVGLNSTMQANALAFWVVMNGYRRVFAIAQDYSFGRTFMTAFRRKLNELDPSVELIGEAYHPLGEQDIRPYIRDIMAANPDIVVTPNWGTDLITLVNQSGELGMETKFAGLYFNDKTLFESLEYTDTLLGSVQIDYYAPSIPAEANKQFIEHARQAFEGYPFTSFAVSYMTYSFWAEAVETAGTDDVEAVIDAWEGLIYDGPAGKWYMRPCDHQAQLPMWVGEIVKENPFYEHPFPADATTIPVRFFTVPCEQTGCPGLSSK